MASQYSHPQFFRRVPHLLLAQYFSSRGIFLNLDWENIKPSEVEMILDAFKQLEDAPQAEIEAQLQDVHALASDGGIAALMDEAEFHGDGGFADEIAKPLGFMRSCRPLPSDRVYTLFLG